MHLCLSISLYVSLCLSVSLFLSVPLSISVSLSLCVSVTSLFFPFSPSTHYPWDTFKMQQIDINRTQTRNLSAADLLDPAKAASIDFPESVVGLLKGADDPASTNTTNTTIIVVVITIIITFIIIIVIIIRINSATVTPITKNIFPYPHHILY